jgi:hypothetical protein
LKWYVLRIGLNWRNSQLHLFYIELDPEKSCLTKKVERGRGEREAVRAICSLKQRSRLKALIVSYAADSCCFLLAAWSEQQKMAVFRHFWQPNWTRRYKSYTTNVRSTPTVFGDNNLKPFSRLDN